MGISTLDYTSSRHCVF